MHQQSRRRRIQEPLLCPGVDAIPIHAFVLVVDGPRQQQVRMSLQEADGYVCIARDRVMQGVQAVTWE